MIEAEGVSKSYPAPGGEAAALLNVSMDARKGELTLVLGPSGSGKSTLLGVLGGLIAPSRGTVRIGGEDIWALSEAERARRRAVDIGFVLQSAPAVSSLTVLENVELAARFTGAPVERGRASELLRIVGLEDKALRRPWQLSGGEKRRLAIAGALLNRPSAVLADEPTGDLDADTEATVMDLFARTAEDGAAVVIVTHNREHVPRADRVYAMNRGSLLSTVRSAGARQASGKAQ